MQPRIVSVIVASMSFLFMDGVRASSKHTLEKIVIGLVIQQQQAQISDMTNEYELISKSVDQALEEMNQDSKKNGIIIEVQKFHYGIEDTSVIPAIQEALKSNAVALVGASPSPFAILAAKEIKNKDIVLIPPLASANVLAQDFPSILMMSNRAEIGAKATGEILKSAVKSKHFLAPVTWERTASRNSWDGLPEDIKSKGELFKIFEANPDIEGFRKKLREGKYDAVFSPNFPGITAQLIIAANAENIKIPFVGNGAWGENVGGTFQKLTNTLPFRGLFSREYTLWMPSKKLNDFRKKLEPKTKDPFSSTAVLYYDAVRYLSKEIITCGKNCDRSKLRNLIVKNSEFPGIFKNYRFDKRKDAMEDSKHHLIGVDGEGFKYIGEIFSDVAAAIK